MGENLAAAAILISAFGSALLFVVSYRREGTYQDAVRRFGGEVMDAITEEARLRTRRTFVRWLVGGFAVLGLGATGFAALSSNVGPGTVVTLFNDIKVGGDVALTFFSPWNTATGNGSAALHDGTVWGGDDLCSSAQGWDSVQTIVAAPGTPPAGITNAMRHEYRLNGGVGDGLCGGISDTTVTASTPTYARVWMRSTETENVTNHALTLGVSNFQFQLAREGYTPGWLLKVKQATADIPRNGQFSWHPGDTTTSVRDTLNHDEWYRVEVLLDFVDDTLYRIFPRVYDEADVLIHDYRTFLGSEHAGGSGVTLGTHYDGGGAFVMNNAADWTVLQLAQEGAFGETDNRGEFSYWAGLALSEEGWIGDLVPGG